MNIANQHKNKPGCLQGQQIGSSIYPTKITNIGTFISSMHYTIKGTENRNVHWKKKKEQYNHNVNTSETPQCFTFDAF